MQSMHNNDLVQALKPSLWASEALGFTPDHMADRGTVHTAEGEINLEQSLLGLPRRHQQTRKMRTRRNDHDSV
jgi:hypothetical protein